MQSTDCGFLAALFGWELAVCSMGCSAVQQEEKLKDVRMAAVGAAVVQQLLCLGRPSCFLFCSRLMFPNLGHQICTRTPACPHIQALIKDALKAVGWLPWPCRSEPLA